jgi:predicted RNase H-like HicB family nuclease
MKTISYVLYREDEFIVAQCLNVDVSSFGATREEAVAHLKEAVELCFEGESGKHESPGRNVGNFCIPFGREPDDFARNRHEGWPPFTRSIACQGHGLG